MSPTSASGRIGLAYGWAGFTAMWSVWVCFVIFLAAPRRLAEMWPLPTVDHGGWIENPLAAAVIDLGLVGLFGLQHSLMARRWFKEGIMAGVPAAFERCTYVHAANLALFAVIVFWQPIPLTVWHIDGGFLEASLWVLFAAGWIILFLGALSFGMQELLGLEQMRAWVHGRPFQPSLKTGRLYRWLRHPMYVGVLLGVWATPRMTVGHVLLALALSGYVLIAMRYEERDLLAQFGSRYSRWRQATN